jgi:3-hydroxy-9,10-secoandrosta-1,3,5(10)-triene-9,17-dione monooxygenase reductase component
VTAFDSKHFRSVMGAVPTSVVVVTGFDSAGSPHGITIGSFVSVSLDPPLVGFLPGVSSKTWLAIRDSRKFCVNVLSASQDELCWRFAKEAENRFEGVEWSPSANGAPALAGSLATLDCELVSDDQYGDHYFVVGRVTDLDASDAGDAMAFYRGKVVGVSHPS